MIINDSADVEAVLRVKVPNPGIQSDEFVMLSETDIVIELILIGKPDGHHGLSKFRGLLLTGEHSIGGRRQQSCRLFEFRKAPSEVAILHIVGELEFPIFIGAVSCECPQQGFDGTYTLFRVDVIGSI